MTPPDDRKDSVFASSVASVINVPLKSFGASSFAVLACNVLISDAALDNPVLIILKLSLKPCVSLSTPAIG